MTIVNVFEEEEIETIHFTFNDGFKCLLDMNSLKLYDIENHDEIVYSIYKLSKVGASYGHNNEYIDHNNRIYLYFENNWVIL